jgi:protein TonB
MFERYMGAKQERPNKWVRVTITVSFAAHVIGILGLLIYSFWKIEKLPVKDTSVLYMAAAMATPPPPPPPPPPPKRSSVKKTEVKKPTEVVQPTKDQKPPEPEPAAEETPDNGVEGGVEGGVAGGEVGGELGGELGGTLGGQVTAPAPPPPPAAPQNVAQAMLEGSRIAGDPQIQLGDANVMLLQQQGVRKLQVKTQMCLTDGGQPKSISFKKSSGYSEIDAKIRNEMGKWRYRPYVVAGKAVPVCFMVIFNYKIQ